MNEVHDAARHDEEDMAARHDEYEDKLHWRWAMYCGLNSRKVSCLPVRQDHLCLTTEDPPRRAVPSLPATGFLLTTGFLSTFHSVMVMTGLLNQDFVLLSKGDGL